GEFKYVIDHQPHAGGAPREDRKRGGRPGGDRGRGGGGDRGRGGGGGGGGGDRGRGGWGGGGGGPGGFKPRQPMGLKSLTKADKQGPGAPRTDREERGPMPSLGQGWMLTRAPGDPRDQ